MDYRVDPVRQGIAESWPDSINAAAAKEEWDFEAAYDMDVMTLDMLEKVREKIKKNSA